MPTRETEASAVDRLRGDIDRGRTGEKAPGLDPAAAPLGTDSEAAGVPPTPQERTVEQQARPTPPLLARLGLTSDGSSGDPRRATAERGRALLDLQVEAGLAQIRRFTATKQGS